MRAPRARMRVYKLAFRIQQQETYYETYYHSREVVRVLTVDHTGIRMVLATAAIIEDSLTAVTRRAGWPEAASRRWHSDGG